jgi:hypothetical protein
LTLALAVLAGLTVLGLANWAMSSVARPSDHKSRLAALEQSVAEIERGAAERPGVGVTEKTLCRGALLPATSALRSSLVRQAGGAGMILRSLDAAPGAAAGSLADIDVSFAAQGSYAGAVKLMSLLEGMSPEVFVDSVEIAPAAGKVSLKVKGRAFCWNSVRR